MNTRTKRSRSHRPDQGFTLAEVAVTIVIVGIALVLVLHGMNGAKMTAAHTSNTKLARDLALLTLGEVEAGLFQEDLDRDLIFTGSYAEQGYEQFYFEIALGDQEFTDRESTDDGRFDSWRPDPYAEEDEDEDATDEETAEPYEKVRIRVTYPPQEDFPNDLVLEKWMRWEQVYGEDEEAATTSESTATDTDEASATGSATGSSSGTGTSGTNR